MEKLGGQAEEFDLFLEMISKFGIFGKFILEAVCEKWVRIRSKNQEDATISK